ncbi:type III secretion system inner membrane ring lipoprotein SctJ [Paraburkholderia rhizosphaerae]|uniref:Lipoprotein n=1 Tax=Paraburkholderia rhizosphaerae TaxID=480658 RepID=A0A4R8LYU7_9BURK|nr:type III secretion inner membrane ring lipoprotein SctJ [Paraburkholderia rhizosphaerae]TDY53573.1 type III secretion protein J [Paraburkholderia rhizosphaerae]
MRRRLLIALSFVLVAGCKTSLFEGLDEDQANRIVAVLSHHGIEGIKQRNPDKTWTVSVDSNDAVAATELTGAYALPRSGHANLGELFSRQGLISNPDEDRVRFIFGVSQELSDTLERIDGVLIARVHIVQPERDPVVGLITPPSASVMLRYRTDYNLELMRDKIRALVAGGVEGLTPDRVNLTLIPVTPVLVAGDACSGSNACADGRGPTGHASATLVLVASAVAVMLLTVSAWVWRSGIRSFSPTFFRRRKRRLNNSPGSNTDAPPDEAKGDTP